MRTLLPNRNLRSVSSGKAAQVRSRSIASVPVHPSANNSHCASMGYSCACTSVAPGSAECDKLNKVASQSCYHYFVKNHKL